MLNRKFTERENLLLLLFTAMLLAVGYYYFVAKPVRSSIEACRMEQAALDDELSLQIMKAAKKKKMLDDMEGNPPKTQGEIVPYNNLKQEMNELYDILTDASSYSLSFSEAVATGNIVRRNINISFQTETYEKASSILEQMKNSRFRSLIRDVSLVTGTGRNSTRGLSQAELVSASVRITYYETTIGAENTDGLVREKK